LKDLEYLIIDEISMIGSSCMKKIDQSLRIGKSNSKPFGGVNIIVLGDFFQFSPVKDTALYIDSAFWTLFNKVIILRENFRQKNDERFLTILNNWKKGNMTSSDWDLLNARTLSSHVTPNLNDSTIIVSRNSLRREVNLSFSKHYSGPKKSFISIDSSPDITLEKYPILVQQLRKLSDEKTNLLQGELTVYYNMKIMLTKNISTTLGLSKGTRGFVHGWTDEILFFKSAIPIPVTFPGLERDVVPIERTSTRFRYRNFKIIRKQIPVIPSYCITDYRAQGDTHSSVVVDIRQPPTGTWPTFEATYVMLSRVTSLSGLFLIPGFVTKTVKPPLALQKEVERLNKLDSITRRLE